MKTTISGDKKKKQACPDINPIVFSFFEGEIIHCILCMYSFMSDWVRNKK